jgi:ATP-dependent DNA helicase RecQ
MEIALDKLRDMYDFCVNGTCRHKAIVSYFGQELDKESCDACDVCLNQVELLDDPLIISQKILSCVARLKGRFNAGHIGRVLVGSKDQRILQFGHDKLTTWGILSDEGSQSVRIWIDQLISQKYLLREGKFNVISITDKGWQLLKGKDTPSLLKPAEKAEKQSRIMSSDSWEGVDMGLFNVLRTLRREKADEQNIPAFIVFGDAALRDMARLRPSTLRGFLNVSGVGQKKCETYGDDFIRVIVDYCTENSIPTMEQDKDSNLSVIKQRAFNLFKKGLSVKEVAQSIGRAISTTYGYLEEYIKYEGITDPSQWISSNINTRILEAIEAVGMDRLKPIFEFFNGEISYDLIRISVACFRNQR